MAGSGSLAAGARCGLAVGRLTLARPRSQACVACVRVLKARAACSHLSRRTRSTRPSPARAAIIAAMHPIPFLREFVIIMAAAVVVVLGCHRLRIPPVVGLLITGLVIGPSGLRLVAERTTVDVFAEIGIVFLLF